MRDTALPAEFIGSRSQSLGAAITVGTFDGVHRGHWSVLQRVCAVAAEHDLLSLLVTFDPHPLKIVRPEDSPPLLTTPNEKKEILTLSGLDYAVFLSFTRSLSLYLPEEFVADVLMNRFGLKRLVVGYDHGFGRGRSGDPDTLRRIGAQFGFEFAVLWVKHGGGLPTQSISFESGRHFVDHFNFAFFLRLEYGRAF